MTFRLGQLSESKLADVDLGVVACVRRAIEITAQDFSVFEGLRDIERQKKLFASGASRTMNSFHLPDRFGLSHAVDLVPFIDGRQQWQTPLCLKVAVAMRQAAIDLDVPITSGLVWDRQLKELDPKNLEREVAAYIVRYQRIHGPSEHPLIDPPHYQTEREAVRMAA